MTMEYYATEDEMLALAIAASLDDQDKKQIDEVTWHFGTIYEHNNGKKSVFLFQSEDPLPEVKIIEHKDPLFMESPARSIVIKPTYSSFKNYNSNLLLHCGITDSQGNVYNFDQRGPRKDSKKWTRCIAQRLNHPALDDKHWDEQLMEHNKEEKRREKSAGYRDLSNNCYDYIIRFLNNIKFGDKATHTKEDIVLDLLNPVDLFESFFKIHKKIEEEGIYVRELTSKEQSD